MSIDEQYMSRCIQLAKLGAGSVAPNPMVGAVLVYEGKIIGEGYHQKYGEAHAEVNCINSVAEKNKSLIKESVIYVSLEPCSHYGKTPPCSDLIIKNSIKKVIIGIKDIFPEVSGKGIKKLQDAELEVITGVLENECHDLNKRFFTFHQKKRPYIILKWAQSANGKTGSNDERIFISNDYSNRLVHKWRSEEAAILVGTNTVLKDNPSLTTRLWNGHNPTRIVVDKELKVSSELKIFNNEARTIIFNCSKNSVEEKVVYIKLGNKNFLEEMLQALYKLNVQSVLIEGGTKTLQSFIDSGLWEEARVITNEKMIIENEINAPEMKNFKLIKKEKYFSDKINYYEKS
ncbi:MAG TPA: bifunctional diaminohydroxyphosphoribosylaminopyrimidine deaminase/5-amino-6-(5-phosphoribosylamino)uracil reductase RibD [Hanamia sp.]|nr:bifunctional diaminohydroxyphosphoribosylaminopyrimidine deaminase/5-amino-6-(5-phosphoribosylamino)uracil reductase RibD [Hanamia sp.]